MVVCAKHGNLGNNIVIHISTIVLVSCVVMFDETTCWYAPKLAAFSEIEMVPT